MLQVFSLLSLTTLFLPTILTDVPVTKLHWALQTSFISPLFQNFGLLSSDLLSVQLAILLLCEAA